MTAGRRRADLVWRPTVAHVRAVAIGVLLTGVALVAGRPDLLVVATPFAMVATWSTVTRPRRAPVAVDRFGNPVVREGDATTWHAEIHDVDSSSVDFVTARIKPMAFVEMQPEGGAVTSPLTADGPAHVAIALRSTRWGRRTIEPTTLTVVARWAAFEWSMQTPHRSLHTLPVPSGFDTDAPHRPSRGLVGLYRSSRNGEGGEFAGVRDFAVGDRIRRINWPRSMRGGTLTVNSTWSDLDTHVALIVDASADYGASEGVDGAASSLDTTVRAAGAIAEHTIGRGDRISLQTFGAVAKQPLPAASGAAHLRRVLDGLTRIRAAGAFAGGGRRRATTEVEGRAELTVMLSPLIERAALDRAVALGRRGRAVVVIDTLPDDIAVDDDPYTSLAWRIRLLERRREIRRVQQVGIPVVRWRGARSLDQFLRDAARRASAPRLRVR